MIKVLYLLVCITVSVGWAFVIKAAGGSWVAITVYLLICAGVTASFYCAILIALLGDKHE